MNIIKDFNDYQNEVKRTINSTLSEKEQLKNFRQSFAEEVGELLGVDKKIKWHGHSFESQREKLVKELGDCYWYLTALVILNECEKLFTEKVVFIDFFELKIRLHEESHNIFSGKNFKFYNTYLYLNSFAKEYNINLLEIWNENAAKLRTRYKNEFTKEESINRVN